MKIKDDTIFYEKKMSNYLLKRFVHSISCPLVIFFSLLIYIGKYPKNYKARVVILICEPGSK